MKARRPHQIVCGTDFSAHAAEAAAVAAMIARKRNGTLLLVHAIPDATKSKDGMPGQYAVDLAAEKLDAWVRRFRDIGTTVVEHVVSGNPDDVLLEFSRQPETQLLVLSSIGHVAPSRLLSASIAERTAQVAAVPTLVIRGTAPFEDWGGARNPLRILVGTDFSETSDTALKWAAGLGEVGLVEIVAGYVYSPSQESDRLGEPEGAGIPGKTVSIEKILERDLRTRIDLVLGTTTLRVRLTPNPGTIEAGLIDLACQERADLVVVGTHQRHGLNRYRRASVSRGILHDTPMSVAFVPTVGGVDSSPAPSPRFRRVLVTTDLSELGNRAIPYAYAAVEPKGTVCILHVAEAFEFPDPALAQHPAQAIPAGLRRDEAIRECTGHLRSLVPAGAKKNGVRTEIQVLAEQDPATAICQAAERFGADLICIASHGRSGITRALLGSVASKVVATSHRPVLVVRPPKS